MKKNSSAFDEDGYDNDDGGDGERGVGVVTGGIAMTSLGRGGGEGRPAGTLAPQRRLFSTAGGGGDSAAISATGRGVIVDVLADANLNLAAAEEGGAINNDSSNSSSNNNTNGLHARRLSPKHAGAGRWQQGSIDRSAPG